MEKPICQFIEYPERKDSQSLDGEFENFANAKRARFALPVTDVDSREVSEI